MRNLLLRQARGVGLKPAQVVVRRRGRNVAAGNLGHGPVFDVGVRPFPDFSMAVGKRQRAAGAVIARRHILPGRRWLHLHPEETIIDGIAVLIDENFRSVSTRISDDNEE